MLRTPLYTFSRKKGKTALTFPKSYKNSGTIELIVCKGSDQTKGQRMRHLKD